MAENDHKKPKADDDVELAVAPDGPEVEDDVPPPPSNRVIPTSRKPEPTPQMEEDFGVGEIDLPMASRSISLETDTALRKPRREDRRQFDNSPPPTTVADINRALSDPPKPWGWYLVFLAILGGVGFLGHKFYMSGREFQEKRANATPVPLPLSKQSVNPALESSPTATPSFLPSRVGSVQVEIETDVVGFEVLVDGNLVQTVDNKFDAPEGRSEIEIRKMGFEPYVVAIVAASGSPNTIRPVFAQEKQKGFLSYETSPDAKLSLYQGEKMVMEKNTPFRGLSLPAGTYKAVLENTFIGIRIEEEVVITAWQTTVRRHQLQHAP